MYKQLCAFLAGSRSCQPDDHWEHSPHPHAPDRPASRTDVDSRRFVEIGRLSTRDWEERIQQQGSSENLNAFRTPPPRRRELSLSHATTATAAGKGEEQQAGQQRRGVRTPEPPPPVEPAAAYVAANRERSPPLPPPPAAANSSGGGSWLSAASVNQLMSEEEDRGAIVQQWVESTSHQVGFFLQRPEPPALIQNLKGNSGYRSGLKFPWTGSRFPHVCLIYTSTVDSEILRHRRRIPVAIPVLKPEASSGEPLKVLPPVVGFERMNIILLT